jgi:hypothetical protein
MSLTPCKSRHKCANGAEGSCNLLQGHLSPHFCGACMSFFDSSEQSPQQPPDNPSMPGQPGDVLNRRAIQSQRKGADASHTHCFHCGVSISRDAATCARCRLRICKNCSDANCPGIVEPERLRAARRAAPGIYPPCRASLAGNRMVPAQALKRCDAKHSCTDGTQGACDSMNWHGGRHTCDHCQNQFSLPGEDGSVWCLLPCPSCRTRCRRSLSHAGQHVCDNGHAYTSNELGTTAIGTRDVRYCPHCRGMVQGSFTKGCWWCHEWVCDNCSSDNCPQLVKCAHCGQQIAMSENYKCRFCGYYVCNACSEYQCPQAPKVNCAHCGKTTVESPYKCHRCGYCLCDGCSDDNCPRKE